MKTNWFTDSGIERWGAALGIHIKTFPDALRYESQENTFENFEVFEGLDFAIVKAVEDAATEVFGKRFKRFLPYGRPDKMVVIGHTAPQHMVDIHSSLYIEYGGLMDFIADSGAFMRIFGDFRNAVSRRLSASYPVKVMMTHNGSHKRVASYNLCVRVESKMPMKVAA